QLAALTRPRPTLGRYASNPSSPGLTQGSTSFFSWMAGPSPAMTIKGSGCELPESGLQFQAAGMRLCNRWLALPAAGERVGALDALRQGRGEKSVDITVEHRAGVPRLHPRPQVFHHLIGLQHIGADLVAPADIGLGGVHRLDLGFAPLQFQF